MPCFALLTALGACAQPAPPPPRVGGPCAYATQATQFTVAAPARQTAEGVDIAFHGPTGDVFVAHLPTIAAPRVEIGQAFAGAIKTETQGTCTPVISTVMINGAAYPLSPQPK